MTLSLPGVTGQSSTPAGAYWIARSSRAMTTKLAPTQTKNSLAERTSTGAKCRHDADEPPPRGEQREAAIDVLG
jgi:hypothetical protein